MKNSKRELLALIQEAAKDQQMLDLLLNDLLSPKEYEEISARVQIVKKLLEGDVQREVAESLGVSIVTVTRGARTLLNKEGGFNLLLS
jgi:TrpR family transcriptional regulator, trp operon repressor